MSERRYLGVDSPAGRDRTLCTWNDGLDQCTDPAPPVYTRRSGWIDAAIHPFGALTPNQPLPGPAIIERESTTIWLPPDTRATLDVYGNLAIDLQQPGSNP